MKDQANTVPILAVGISLIVHVLFLLLVPYNIPRQHEPPLRQLIPVNLLEPPPAPRTPAIQRSALRTTAPADSTKGDAPEPREVPLVEEARPIDKVLLPRQDPPPAPDRVVSPSAETAAVAEGAPRTQQAPAASMHAGIREAVAAVQPSAEIAAYQVILSTLRGRIVEGIRYPAIARANGWQGTVIVAVRLDAAGKLEQTIIRQSSGYEVLDRAAAALLKKVTPVANPLSLPVTIEIPIVYELK
jgi:protein TonB